MRSSFLPKCRPKITKISALPSSKLPGQKSLNFLVGILGETMTSWIHSEFNWPLVPALQSRQKIAVFLSILHVLPTTRIILGLIKTFFLLLSLCSKRKLIPWLKVILRNQTILETFYTNWSYVVKSGMYSILHIQ